MKKEVKPGVKVITEERNADGYPSIVYGEVQKVEGHDVTILSEDGRTITKHIYKIGFM